MNKFQYKVQGVDYDVEINDVEGNIAKVTVNGIPFEVEMKQPVKATQQHKPVVVNKPLSVEKPQAPAPEKPKPAAAPADTTSGTKVMAPLPGTITEVCVAVGDAVKTGDTVVVLEAMKMMNNIEAEATGTIKAVLVNKGDSVLEGTVLVIIG